MYNGIGLSTPRGSGTNGYVVRNLSFVRPPPMDRNDRAPIHDFKAPLPEIRQPNQEILLHDRKRKIEVQCMHLQIKLEDEGLSEDAIEKQVQTLREQLKSNFEKVLPRNAKDLLEHETHQLTAAKEHENKKMMMALNIKKTNYVEGAAFDRE
ncbi:cwf21 domain-containing protein, partial [Spinellus fusiger]